MEKEIWDEFKKERKSRVENWKDRGFPDLLIERGLRRADEWLQKMSRKFISEHPALIGRYPRMLKDIQRSDYPDALNDAETYMEEVANVIGVKIKKLEEVI